MSKNKTIIYRGRSIRPHGKKFRLYNGATQNAYATLQECYAVIDALEAQKEGVRTIQQAVQETVGEAVDRYMRGDASDITKRNVRQTMSTIPRDIPLVSISEEWLRSHFIQPSWKTSTLRCKMLNLRGVLTLARKAGRAVNPTAYFTLPKQKGDSAAAKYVASEDDLDRVCSYATMLDWRMRFAFMAIAAWGIRVGNMVRLRLEHAQKTGDFILPAYLTKQRKDQCLAVYPELEAFVGKAMTRNREWLFEQDGGAPYTAEAIWTAWKRMRAATGLPMKLTPYSFRRRMDRLLAERGVSPHLHAGMMGHALRTIASNYMTHDLDAYKKKWCGQKSNGNEVLIEFAGEQQRFASVHEAQQWLGRAVGA